jgi:hypothetical protein
MGNIGRIYSKDDETRNKQKIEMTSEIQEYVGG